MYQQQPTYSNGSSAIQQVVEQLIRFHLGHGGKEVARNKVDSLAPSFSFMDEWAAAYRWALDYIEEYEPDKKPNRRNENGEGAVRDDDTPLCALFDEKHYDELRQTMEGWLPVLADTSPSADVLHCSHFNFDLSKVSASEVYLDLVALVNRNALKVPLARLAEYMFLHSNLSKSQGAIYQQLKRFKKICK